MNGVLIFSKLHILQTQNKQFLMDLQGNIAIIIAASYIRKLLLPAFSGLHPEDWLRKVERYPL